MNMLQIKDELDPRLEPFRRVRDVLARQAGEIIIDSARVVERYLKLGLPLKSLLSHSSFLEEKEKLISAYPNADVFTCDRELLTKIVGYRLHSGVIAIGERPKDVDISEVGSTVIFLNGVNNSENVGAILRNALAFGATDLVVDSLSCSPWVRRCIRVSMGAVFKCRIHHTTNALETVAKLKKNSYKVFAATYSEMSQDINRVKIPDRRVVIIGCEGDGIQPELAAAADQHIHVEMNDGIDSLNAAVASGIILHHFRSSR